MAQIPDKTLKATPTGNDLLLIRDMTSNTDKRTTVNGLARGIHNGLGKTRFKGYNSTSQGGTSATPVLLSYPAGNVGSQSITTTGHDLVIHASIAGYMAASNGTGGFGVRVNSVFYPLYDITSTTLITEIGFTIINGSALPAGTYTIELMAFGSGTVNHIVLAFNSATLLAYELASVS